VDGREIVDRREIVDGRSSGRNLPRRKASKSEGNSKLTCESAQ